METKRCPAEFKVRKSDDGKQGTVEAIVSVFGNRDLGGDVVEKGAFADSLKAWQESGDPIPWIFGHQWDNLAAYTGLVDPKNAEEIEGGLRVKADMDIGSDQAAAKLFDLLERRIVKEFSFAYDIVESEKKEQDGEETHFLKALDLIECGPCLKGMNPSTQLIGTKDIRAAVKAELGGSLLMKEIAEDASPGEVAAATSELAAAAFRLAAASGSEELQRLGGELSAAAAAIVSPSTSETGDPEGAGQASRDAGRKADTAAREAARKLREMDLLEMESLSAA